MILLGQPKLSGCVAVTSNEKGTLIARMPTNAAQPAHLCVRNIDAAAVIYLRTIWQNQGGKVTATTCGVLLSPGEAYDWNGAPPRGADVFGLSTVNNSLVAVEQNYSLSEEED